MTATYYGHISWGGQRHYLIWQRYLSWPFFLTKTAKLPQMTAIPIMAMFLEEDSETTWNDSYTFLTAMFLEEDSETIWNHNYIYCGHVSWGKQQNYLKWQLDLEWPYVLRGTAKLPEMRARSSMAIFLEEDSETTWNDSYTYYGHAFDKQQNYLKWQLYL